MALQHLLAGLDGTGVPQLNGLVRGAAEEQVTHGIDDRALGAHAGSFALEDLLRCTGFQDAHVQLCTDVGQLLIQQACTPPGLHESLTDFAVVFVQNIRQAQNSPPGG